MGAMWAAKTFWEFQGGEITEIAVNAIIIVCISVSISV